MIGETVKVRLPGETPWVEILEENGNEFKGRILNRLVPELTDIEQAQLMKRDFGSGSTLPKLHDFVKGDEIWFQPDPEGYEYPVPKGGSDSEPT